MFHHVKELQFNARVSGPDPKFAKLLLEQFGGGNGELKAAMQYFTQAFCCRKPYPAQYDMLMDIATEEFSHLEIVGATITMLLEGVNGELKDAAQHNSAVKMVKNVTGNEEMIHEAWAHPHFYVLTGGGPHVTDSQGVPWSGAFVNADGDLTVDLRSNIAAESRAKIVYEYLMKFTDDPHVRETLAFLMTREIAHFQMFTAALDDISPNFPPGILQGDPRFTHLYFDMSDGESARGPWNQGRGPWNRNEEWVYVDNPEQLVDHTHGLVNQPIQGSSRTADDVEQIERKLSKQRSGKIKAATGTGEAQWCSYEPSSLQSPGDVRDPQ